MELNTVNNSTETLLDQGVKMPLPATVYIGPEVDIDRISGENVTLHPGTRITGENTLILQGTILGEEAPVTVDNCYIGADTRLKGGFFQNAAFAGKNSFGSGAHVRGGTILEEEANAAHTVGLKQTILFPFVTLGSLINFCDLLMAGGTSRKNHSEVGSSYIHFNYTPNQDKATPSMIGNVHQGVMLDQPPIFLGGQGGLVGPRSLAFGTVVAAGTICRADQIHPNRLVYGASLKAGSIPNSRKIFGDVKGILEKNIAYINGLCGLLAWYEQVRCLFVSDVLTRELLKGMQLTLKQCIKERIHRLDGFCKNFLHSRETLPGKADKKAPPQMDSHFALLNAWPDVLQRMEAFALAPRFSTAPELFLTAVEDGIRRYGADYVTVIQDLSPDMRALGITWLESLGCDF